MISQWIELSTFLAVALFHVLWMGALIGIVSFSVARTKAFQLADPQTGYLLSLTALIALLLSIPLAVLVAYASLSPTPDSFLAVNTWSNPTTAIIAQEPPGKESHDGFGATARGGQSLGHGKEANLPVVLKSSVSSGQPESLVVPPTESTRQTGAAPDDSTLDPSPIWSFSTSVVAAGYFAGLFLMLARFAWQLVGGERLRQRAELLEDTQVNCLLSRVVAKVGLQTIPEIRLSSSIGIPVSCGIWKPAVLLPFGLVSSMTTAELEMILLHELIHIRRHDNFVLLLQRCVETILFFHPVTWMLSKATSYHRECCCDQRVIDSGCAPAEYLHALCRVVEFSHILQKNTHAYEQAALLAATGNSEPELLLRARRILDESPKLTGRLSRLSMATVFPGLLLVAYGYQSLLAGSSGLFQEPNKAAISYETKVTYLAELPPKMLRREKVQPVIEIPGRVLDDDKRPVSNATVWVIRKRRRFETSTDLDGNFLLSLPAEFAFGSIAQAGSNDKKLRGSQLIVREDEDSNTPSVVTITLLPAKTVQVQVYDAHDNPVVDAIVGATVGSDEIIDLTKTNREGRASFELSQNTIPRLIFATSPELGWDYRSTRQIAEPDNLTSTRREFPPTEISLQLSGMQTAEFMILDDRGIPLPNASVAPFTALKANEETSIILGNINDELGLYESSTNQKGETILDWIPAWANSPIRFSASCEGYEPVDLSFNRDESIQPLTTRLTKLLPFSGRIVDQNGNPIPHLEVRMHGGGLDAELQAFHSVVEFTTDLNGAFETEISAYCRYIAKPQHSHWRFAEPFDLLVQHTPLEPMELTVDKGTQISGRMTIGSEHKPLANHRFSVNQETNGLIVVERKNHQYAPRPAIGGPMTTDAEGKFEVRLGQGHYWISGGIEEEVRHFDITGQDELVFNFHSELPEQIPLEGSIVDAATGELIPNARLMGIYTDKNQNAGLFGFPHWPQVLADEKGRFSIEKKPFDLFLAAVNEDDTMMGFAEIPAKQESTKLELYPFQKVRGRLIDSLTKKPITGQQVSCSIRIQRGGSFTHLFEETTKTDKQGHFEVARVAPGQAYSLSLVTLKEGRPSTWKHIDFIAIEPSEEVTDLGNFECEPLTPPRAVPSRPGT